MFDFGGGPGTWAALEDFIIITSVDGFPPSVGALDGDAVGFGNQFSGTYKVPFLLPLHSLSLIRRS